jgi:membrane protein
VRKSEKRVAQDDTGRVRHSFETDGLREPASFRQLLSSTFTQFRADKVPRMGAALAYYTIFSITPLVVISIAVAGVVFGREAAQGAIVDEIRGVVGVQTARIIEAMIMAADRPASGLLATIVGIVVLLVGASGVFGEMRDALNTIWDVQSGRQRGLLGFIKDRFASFTMVAGVGFLLLVSLVVSAALSALGALWRLYLPMSQFLLQAIDFLVSLGVIGLLFAMIYRVLPAVRLAWRDVWAGAGISALLFTVGKAAIGLYLGRTATASTYGAAGALVVLMVWVYYSAQIFYFGAEFTRLYVAAHASRRAPRKGAASLPTAA